MRKNVGTRLGQKLFLGDFWLKACAISSIALGLPACEGFSGDNIEEPYLITGIGQTWVYSTRTQGVASSNYRPLLGKNLPTCPPPISAGDNCRFSTCRYDPAKLPAPVSAGAIRISGLADDDIVLEPGEELYQGSLYEPQSRDSRLLEGGETVRFEIPGSEGVPTASKSLVAPEFINVTEPVYPEPEESDEEEEEEEAPSQPTLPVDRGSDLSVAWDPLPNGDPVTITLTVRHEEDAENVVNYSYACTLDSSLGGAKLSREYLEKFPASEDSGPASLFVGRDEAAQVLTGQWEHQLFVSSLEAFSVNLE